MTDAISADFKRPAWTPRLQLETDRQVLASSDNPFWRTPQAGFDALLKEFPIAIDLAASAEDTLCETWLGPGSPIQSVDPDAPRHPCADALAFDHWAAFIPEYSYGFLNPPYSRKLKLPIDPWVERCWRTAKEGRSVVAWLPAAIQTVWWQDFVWAGYGNSEERVEINGEQVPLRVYPADEVRLFPHRVSFDPPPGKESSGNANVNSAIVIWEPPRPYVGPWTPTVRYWSYR